jgi:hypothetical protein
MIYHVLREPKMMATPYPGNPGSSESLRWERILQEEVCTYLLHIWRSAGSPVYVYIAKYGPVFQVGEGNKKVRLAIIEWEVFEQLRDNNG